MVEREPAPESCLPTSTCVPCVHMQICTCAHTINGEGVGCQLRLKQGLKQGCLLPSGDDCSRKDCSHDLNNEPRKVVLLSLHFSASFHQFYPQPVLDDPKMATDAPSPEPTEKQAIEKDRRNSSVSGLWQTMHPSPSTEIGITSILLGSRRMCRRMGGRVTPHRMLKMVVERGEWIWIMDKDRIRGANR